MAEMVRAPQLTLGDTIALLSPASPPPRGGIPRAMTQLRQLGFHPVLGKNAEKRTGYLAGTDRQRTRDFQDMLTKKTIKAIFCTRGGYGISRLLEQLDLRCVRQQPKIIVGYSDLTLLHLALQKAGLISFWGPMPASATGLSPFAATWMKKALYQSQPIGLLPPGKAALFRGSCQGRLTGGTLSLLAASIGTPYEIKTKDRIVFLEDIGEEPYRLDRLLTQLLAAGKLADAAGIVLGEFRACQPASQHKRLSFTVQEVLTDRLVPLRIPVISGFPIGHIPDQVTLPYGVPAKLNAHTRSLEILEPAVK